MRTLVLAALAALSLPDAAMADGGPLPVGADGSVALKAGHDYALIGISDQPDTVDLLDPGGKVVATIGTNADLAHGQEFRARYTARYFLRDHDPGAGLGAAVEADCRGDARTLCAIAPGHPKSGALPWVYDQDWRRIRLGAARTYTVTVQSDGSACAIVLDGRGRKLAGDACAGAPLAFTPRASGTYYLAMVDEDVDEGANYSVAVTVAR